MSEDSDSSDHDEEGDDNPLFETPPEDLDDDIQNYGDDENDGDDNLPFYNGAPITVAESMALILSLILNHHLTAACIVDLLYVLHLHCIAQGLRKLSLYRFRQYFSFSRAPVIKIAFQHVSTPQLPSTLLSSAYLEKNVELTSLPEYVQENQLSCNRNDQQISTNYNTQPLLLPHNSSSVVSPSSSSIHMPSQMPFNDIQLKNIIAQCIMEFTQQSKPSVDCYGSTVPHTYTSL